MAGGEAIPPELTICFFCFEKDSTLIRKTDQPLISLQRTKMATFRRSVLRTTPGPGGAGSIGQYTQPCRKIVLRYCETSVASKGVREWIKWSFRDSLTESALGPIEFARKWPQVEFVLQQGKRGSEPSLLAHYVNNREKSIGLHMMSASQIPGKLDLALSSTGRKMAGPRSSQGFNTGEARNHAKRPIESVRGDEPVRGHWSGFGADPTKASDL